ncbi:phosphate ABC transporter substrate-binding protein [Massilia sp. Dwa41.01b]|uniref:phosphate ABC transporter substrate-binding protein n=1 Tax=unclassified Massilia TaxID=2609279 RepID=UPI0016003732|nr:MULTISPECIES: phosphate ABC transporter substrate-binding protein [unclassified Massilia]QNA88584.1 phosphate ABC transporter substrate-binding protein [Massilia sp. Dwa41.01b]QNA99479.1 phosphate ABC transporter substrate-binding protein [Massilia sp. Se16.2.3]
MANYISRLLAAGALLLLPVLAHAGELVVVVSARSPIAALRPDQVSAIFLGQAARFPDGTVATALDQPIGSPERDHFYQNVAGKTPALLKAYWSKMVFTGRGQPPRELRDSLAVRRAVADDPALIGYIDREALDSSVRPVLLVH